MKKIICLALCVITLCCFLVVNCFALPHSEQSLTTESGFDYVTSPYKANSVPVGETLIPSFILDVHSTDTRKIFMEIDSYVNQTPENLSQYVGQASLEYTGITRNSPLDDYTSRWTTINYSKIYLDDGGQRDFMWDPVHLFYYDEVYAYISITRNGEVLDPNSIVITSIDNGGYPDLNAFWFTLDGEYKIFMQFTMINSLLGEGRNYPSVEQTIVVNPSNYLYNEGYNNGYNDGYLYGYQDGVNSDEEWTFLSFIDAIIRAPIDFVEGAFDFDIFGVNVSNAIKVIFTLLIVAFVVVVLLKAVL